MKRHSPAGRMLSWLLMAAMVCSLAGAAPPLEAHAEGTGDMKEIQEIIEDDEDVIELEEGEIEEDTEVPALATGESSDYYYSKLSANEKKIYSALLTYAKSPSDYVLADTYTCTATSASNAYSQDPAYESGRDP